MACYKIGSKHKLYDTEASRFCSRLLGRKSLTTCFHSHGGAELVDRFRDDEYEGIWPFPCGEDGRPYINEQFLHELGEVLMPRAQFNKEMRELLASQHRQFWRDRAHATQCRRNIISGLGQMAGLSNREINYLQKVSGGIKWRS